MLIQIQSFVATQLSASATSRSTGTLHHPSAGSAEGWASTRSSSGQLSPEFDRFVCEWRDIQIVRPCGSGSYGVVGAHPWLTPACAPATG